VIPTTQVEDWLREDVGHHDVTNDVPGETAGRLVATEPGVVAGLDAVVAVFEYLDVAVDPQVENGNRVSSGDTVVTVEGPATAVLRGERVAVNVAGHASGIATLTRRAVQAARSVNEAVTVAGTRKTTPGLRGIEKRAIAAGGGDTHRLDLSHAVMVKDNHVAELGLEEAVTRFRERASFTTTVEVEVERPEQGPRAAEAGADVVLFDNMTPAETAEAVKRLRQADASVITEASGGITLDTVAAYAETGVDVVSMGCLTHSADSLDYSFRTG
jgi:nicotinate-nucleotide pyrophosphorylase (carboxylating)